jgi:type I restriction enzyme, S subunit
VILETPLPVPPENEQRRIVEKVDELFSQIEAGEEALARAQKLLERYRQSILNAAVTGELTREWREQHEGELESGEDLLKRILKARREAWEQAELAKMHARGKPPSDDRWKQKYKEPEPPGTTDLAHLPEGWV